MDKFYSIQFRDGPRWKPLRQTTPSRDLPALIAQVRKYDQDGLFSPSYRIIDEEGAVVASHAHGDASNG